MKTPLETKGREILSILYSIYSKLWNMIKWFTPFREHSMGSNWLKWKYFTKFLDIAPDFKGIIVDVGCGPGNLAMQLAKHYPSAKIIGIDISHDDISKAENRKREQNIENVYFLTGNAVTIPLQSKSIDRVISTQMYEHLQFPENIKFLSEVDRILKVGGYFVLNVPGDLFFNYSFPVYRFLSLFPFFVKKSFLLKYFKENKRYPYFKLHGHVVPGYSPSDIIEHLQELKNLRFLQYGYAFKKLDAIHFQVRSLSRMWGELLAPMSFLFSLMDLFHNSKGLDLTCQIKR